MGKHARVIDRRRVARTEVTDAQLMDARIQELAAGIHTEALLQQVLADVQPAMRPLVEAMIRPLTKLQHG